MRSVHSPATGAMLCGRRHRRRAGSLHNWTHPWWVIRLLGRRASSYVEIQHQSLPGIWEAAGLPGYTWILAVQLVVFVSALCMHLCLQEEHLACKKLSDEVLVWSYVWSEVQMVWHCMWSSWCHCHPSSLASLNPDWFSLSGASLSRLSWKRGH